MKDSIYNPKNNPKDIQYYCVLGKEDFIDDNGHARLNSDSKNVAAKIVNNKKSRQITDQLNQNSYYIKVSPKLEIFNPVELLISVKDKSNNFFINKVCKNVWNFKEVDKLVFDKYIHFLNTKNIKFLKDIERDLK